MAGYVCSSCGLTAHSKCVNQRTLFYNDPDFEDNIDALSAFKYLNHVVLDVNARITPNTTDRLDIEVNISHYYNESLAHADLARAGTGVMRNILRAVQTLGDDAIMAFCHHKWEPTSKCMFGCCEPEN